MLNKLFARPSQASAPARPAKPAINPATGQVVDLAALKARAQNLYNAELIRWDHAFSVNNGLIDEEHKAIMRLLNLLYADWAGSSGRLSTRHVMDELSATVVRHFVNEEALLRENRCPDYEAHRSAHRNFVAEMRHIAATLRREAPPSEVKPMLLDFTRRLVVDHVLTMDQDMARYMR